MWDSVYNYKIWDSAFSSILGFIIIHSWKHGIPLKLNSQPVGGHGRLPCQQATGTALAVLEGRRERSLSRTTARLNSD